MRKFFLAFAILLISSNCLAYTGSGGSIDLNFGHESDIGYYDANGGNIDTNFVSGDAPTGIWTDENITARVGVYYRENAAPTVVIDSPADGYSTTETTVTMTYTGTDTDSSIAKYWVKLNSSAWVDNGTNVSYDFIALSVGSHTLQVKATDTTDLNSAAVSITVTITASSSGDGSGSGGGGGGGGGGGVPNLILNLTGVCAGYPITALVLDRKQLPVEGAEVILRIKISELITKITDVEGKAYFTLEPGIYTLWAKNGVQTTPLQNLTIIDCEGGVEPTNFSIRPSAINIKLKQGERKSDFIYVKNISNESLEMEIDLSDLRGFVRFIGGISEYDFQMDVNEEKIFELEFNIAQDEKLGNYVKQIVVSDGITPAIIPVSLNISSGGALFDVSVDVPGKYKTISAGDELLVQVELYNLGKTGKIDALINYELKDIFENTRLLSQEMLAVETQMSFNKFLAIPYDTKPGEYFIVATVSYDDQIAVASTSFSVTESVEKEFDIFPILTFLGLTIGVFMVLLFFWRKRTSIMEFISEKIEKVKTVKHRKSIEKKIVKPVIAEPVFAKVPVAKILPAKTPVAESLPEIKPKEVTLENISENLSIVHDAYTHNLITHENYLKDINNIISDLETLIMSQFMAQVELKKTKHESEHLEHELQLLKLLQMQRSLIAILDAYDLHLITLDLFEPHIAELIEELSN